MSYFNELTIMGEADNLAQAERYAERWETSRVAVDLLQKVAAARQEYRAAATDQDRWAAYARAANASVRLLWYGIDCPAII